MTSIVTAGSPFAYCQFSSRGGPQQAGLTNIYQAVECLRIGSVLFWYVYASISIARSTFSRISKVCTFISSLDYISIRTQSAFALAKALLRLKKSGAVGIPKKLSGLVTKNLSGVFSLVSDISHNLFILKCAEVPYGHP